MCLNWNIMKKSVLTETEPLPHYPKELPLSNGKLSPKCLDFNIMKNIIRQCSQNKKLKNGVIAMFLQFVLFMEYLRKAKTIYLKN